MAEEVAILRISAEIEEFRKTLAQLPDVTEKEARRAASRLAQQLAKGQILAGKSADEAAKKAASAWRDSFAKARKQIAAENRKAARAAADEWDKAFKGTAKQIGTDLAKGLAIAIAAAPVAAAALGQDVADLRNELADLSDQTGINVETLAGLDLAAKTSGRDVKGFEEALRGLPKRLDDFRRGTGEAAPGLEALGFRAEEAEDLLADMDGTIKEITKRLAGVENPGRQAAIATQIFGEKGAVLNQILGDKTLEDWVDTSERYAIDVGPEAIASAREWQVSVALLGAEFNKTKGEIADTLDLTTNLRNFTTGFIFAREVVTGAVEDMTQRLALLGSALNALVTGDVPRLKQVFVALKEELDRGLTVVNDEVIASATEVALNFALEAKEISNAAAASARNVTVLQLSVQEEKRLADAVKKRSAEEKKAAAASRKLSDIRLAAIDDTLSAEEQLTLAAAKQFEIIAELEKQSGNTAAAQEARAEVRLRLQRDIIAAELEATQAEQDRNAANFEATEKIVENLQREAEVRKQNFEQALSQGQELSNALIGFSDQLLQNQIGGIQEAVSAQESAIDTLKEERKALNEALLEATDIEKQASIKATRETVKAQIQAGRREARESKKQGLKAFKTSKALGRVGVVVNTAAAILKGFAQFGPPPSPPGIAAAAAATLTGATQLAVIQGQKPPQFAIGGGIPPFASFTQTPDSFLAMKEPGEMTLTRRATEAVGKDAIDQLNATGGAPAMGGAVFVQMMNGRVLSRVLAQDVKSGGPLADALGLRGGPTGVQDVFGAG